MIVEHINRYLTAKNFPDNSEMLLEAFSKDAGFCFDRQFGVREEREGGIYLSSIGRCVRQQAYKLHNFQQAGKEIDSRAMMIFFQGDICELTITYLAKLAGLTVTNQQETISLDGVYGHPDGVLVNPDKKRLIEVKSMSSFGYREFENGEIDIAYVYQMNAYMAAMNLSECVFVAMNKDNGVLGEAIVHRDEKIVQDIRRRIKLLKDSKADNLPEGEFKPDEKGYYPWNCLYCGYWKDCHPNAEKVLSGSKYKLKEVK